MNARTLHDVSEAIGKVAARFDAMAQRRRADAREKWPATFAARVKQVSAGLNTSPFMGRVAIAQVYEAYKAKFGGDGGSLATFKHRLVNAAKKRELDLGRLDLPELMENELRQSSTTPWDKDVVHFVVNKWK